VNNTYAKQVIAQNVNKLRFICTDLISIIDSCDKLNDADRIERAYSNLLESVALLQEVKNKL
jgi:hypothetical protein